MVLSMLPRPQTTTFYTTAKSSRSSPVSPGRSATSRRASPAIDVCEGCSSHIASSSRSRKPKCLAAHCRESPSEDGSAYCVGHECTLDDCTERRLPLKLFCDRHVCAKGACTFAKSDDSDECCSAHTCKVEWCTQERADDAQYCWAHRCRIDGCSQTAIHPKLFFCNRHLVNRSADRAKSRQLGQEDLTPPETPRLVDIAWNSRPDRKYAGQPLFSDNGRSGTADWQLYP